MPTQIYLYRHAPVHFDNARIPASKFRDAVTRYDHDPVAPTNPSPIHCRTVLTSNLRRSHDTAIALFGRVDMASPLLREAALPDLPRVPISAKPTTFFAIARVLWLLGRKTQCEGVTAFRNRVADAADLVMRTAQDHGPICVVGHGIMNRALAKALVKHGFVAATPPRYSHGTYTLFTRT